MTTNNQIDDIFFSSDNEVKGAWVTWGKVGDWFKATLIDTYYMDSTFNPGEKVLVYNLKMHGGEFHQLDEGKQVIEPGVIINEGELYSMSGKTGINAQMKNIKKGQIIGLKFLETVPSKTKGYNPAKSIKVYTDGTFDEQWLEENKSVDDQLKDKAPF